MSVELHVGNDCELPTGDISSLVEAQKNLVKERIVLLSCASDSEPFPPVSAIREAYKRRLEIEATEYMIDIAISLIMRGYVSTVSELAKLFQIEVNHGNPYHEVKDKAKAAQDIIDLLQP